MSQEQDPGQIVRAWIAEVNDGRLATAGEFVADSVEIIGPRGATSGRDAVAGWIRHTGIRMTPVAVDVEDNRVVVDASATWRTEGGSPEERTIPATITMELTVVDGRITSIRRLESMDDVPSA